MRNGDKLQRGNYLQIYNDRVVVLSIAKKSLRVYNVTHNEYVNAWIPIRDFEPIPLTLEDLKEEGWSPLSPHTSELVHDDCRDVSIIETEEGWQLKVFAFWWNKIKYLHEVQNVVSVFGRKKEEENANRT